MANMLAVIQLFALIRTRERHDDHEDSFLVAAIHRLSISRPIATPQAYAFCCVLLCVIVSISACGGTAREPGLTIAVAANFIETAESIARDFEEQQQVSVTLISGSTGKLYAQVVNGAPFDVFLAADEVKPMQLEDLGFAEPGSGFTYATGRLILWSPDPNRIRNNGLEVLANGEIRRLAIANPALAPYGAAARDVLEYLGLWDSYEKRIVMGENVGQAYALVATGNAEVGFVARSNLNGSGATSLGSTWDVPPELHAPIAQRAVLLIHGADNAEARLFLDYLQSAAVRQLIEQAGYDVE